MAQTTLTAKSVRITEEESKWLSAAATKGAVTQNDLLCLALHRLRKDLGAASRVKPETVLATARASKYKLTPPRTAAGAVRSTAGKASSRVGQNAKTSSATAARRTRASRPRAA